MTKRPNFESTTLTFNSESEYCSYRANVDFWLPQIMTILEKHQLADVVKYNKATCGFNPTYPVFLIGDIVVKFFGHRPSWKNAFQTERASHEYLLKDTSILAPCILATGNLFEDANNPWPYIISSKIAGKSWLDTPLTFDEKNKVAADIGAQLCKIHALSTNNQLHHDSQWSRLNFTAAAERSVLPKHLVAQVAPFIAKLDAFERCFVNGDIVDTHVFIDNGALSGIIDWGDATVTDKHYELGKLMDTFDWDKRLLKTVLASSNWPIKKNFSKQALGLALYRQAVGLTQHNSFDVFYKLPDLIPLEDIATLDELAEVLFGV